MDDRIRVSDADRERVADHLREHFAQGRLSRDELDERIAAALSAKTFGDLRRIMTDLPGPAPAAPQAGRSASRAGYPAPWGGPGRVVVHRGPRLLPLALFALIVAVALPGAGWVFFGFLQFVLVLWLAVALAGIFAAARFRRPWRRHVLSGDGSYWHQWRD
jgi:Domain of unknown function (DUF1707)